MARLIVPGCTCIHSAGVFAGGAAFFAPSSVLCVMRESVLGAQGWRFCFYERKKVGKGLARTRSGAGMCCSHKGPLQCFHFGSVLQAEMSYLMANLLSPVKRQVGEQQGGSCWSRRCHPSNELMTEAPESCRVHGQLISRKKASRAGQKHNTESWSDKTVPNVWKASTCPSCSASASHALRESIPQDSTRLQHFEAKDGQHLTCTCEVAVRRLRLL